MTIATNGKPDAALQMGAGRPAAPDEITMVFAAALPLSLHPKPQRVANIGFGSGLTSATVLLSERVKSLESIEIEPFMVEAASQGYRPRIHQVFEDPRSRIVIEDAKTFFAMAREPYDVIISEPSNPWVSGVATLFSDEFYGRIVTYLKPDGLLVQWLQIYETDITIIASIVTGHEHALRRLCHLQRRRLQHHDRRDARPGAAAAHRRGIRFAARCGPNWRMSASTRWRTFCGGASATSARSAHCWHPTARRPTRISSRSSISTRRACGS